MRVERLAEPWTPDDALLLPRDHQLDRHLEFLYLGGAHGFLRSAAGGGGEVLAPVGTTPVVDSIDGWGIRSTAADEAWTATLADSTPFTGDVTILWRGVLLGAAGATNSGTLFAVNYSNGLSSPYSIINLSRDSTSADDIVVFRNNGAGTYVAGQVNLGLSGLYNRPLTILASSVAGSTAVYVALYDEHGGALTTGITMNSTSGAPANSSGADVLSIGCNLGAGRYPNAVCTGAAIWSCFVQPESIYDLAADFPFVASQSPLLVTRGLDPTGLPPSVSKLLPKMVQHGAFL